MARMRRSSEQTLEYRIEQAEGEDLTSYLECVSTFRGFIFGSSQLSSSYKKGNHKQLWNNY